MSAPVSSFRPPSRSSTSWLMSEVQHHQTISKHCTRRAQTIEFRRLTETISQVNCTPRISVDLANVDGLLDRDLPRPPSHSMLGGELLVNDLRYFRVWDVPPPTAQQAPNIDHGGRGGEATTHSCHHNRKRSTCNISSVNSRLKDAKQDGLAKSDAQPSAHAPGARGAKLTSARRRRARAAGRPTCRPAAAG